MEVLLIDDHPPMHVFMQGICQAALPEAKLVIESTLARGLAYARRHKRLGLVILDLGLPDSKGIGTLETARRHLPKTPLLVVSADDDCRDILAALEKGADGYAPKTCSVHKIAEAVRAVAAGRRFVPPQIRLADISRVPGASAPRFTVRQTQVLELLIEGLSTAQIAERLAIAEGTVTQHLNAVYQALGVSSRTAAIVRARRLGFGRG
jgi:DNA-binding NarL/FixJ family response regulator